jgi:hypothetical protein
MSTWSSLCWWNIYSLKSDYLSCQTNCDPKITILTTLIVMYYAFQAGRTWESNWATTSFFISSTKSRADEWFPLHNYISGTSTGILLCHSRSIWECFWLELLCLFLFTSQLFWNSFTRYLFFLLMYSNQRYMNFWGRCTW